VYNKYMSGDADAFSELYKPVADEPAREVHGTSGKQRAEKGKLDLKRLLHGLDIDKAGIIPIVLLLLLLLDADDEEKLIIIILAVIFGI